MQGNATLDGISPLEKIKLIGRLSDATKELAAATSPIARIKLAAEVAELLSKLGDSAPAPQPEPAPEQKADTRELYEHREDVTKAQRQRDNNAALELLSAIDAGSVKLPLSADQKKTLALYSGNGGSLVRHDGRLGSAYEYYTPPEVASGIWDMLAEMGFGGGKVLDPSAGTGIFGATAPPTAAIDAVELDPVSGRINELVNGGPGFKVTVSNFETIATKTPDESHDAVVTNVPFGDISDRGANRFDDKKYQNRDLGSYFVLRSLDKLKPGGLAAFIVPRGFVSNRGDGKPSEVRQLASLKAEFMGAYRLPNMVFESAAADVVTDVIVFRKYSRDASEKIGELREQNPDVLRTAGVLWDDFIDGRYFETPAGQKNIIGKIEEVEGRWKDSSGKARLIEAVVYDGTVADIRKLLRKLPPSRIDWTALDTAETTPITYREGDTLALAGQTLEMRDGKWQPIAESAAPSLADIEFGTMSARLTSPIAALEAEVNWVLAHQWYDDMIARDLVKEVPDWFRVCFRSLMTIADDQKPYYWLALCTAMAVRDVKREHMADSTPFDYSKAYPLLHESLKKYSGIKSSPAAFDKDAKKALELARTVYSRKAGYIGWWLGKGEALTEKEVTGTTENYEKLRYGGGDNPDAAPSAFRYVSIADMKAHDAQFDPLASDEWCISPDGESVMHADDYYLGNLQEFYDRVDAELKATKTDAIRAKIAHQRALVESRVRRIDPAKLRFTMHTPLVKLEDKLRFVRENIDTRFELVYPETGEGDPLIKIDLNSASIKNRNSPEYIQTKAMELMWAWFKNGTTRLGALPEGVSDATRDEILKEIRRLGKTANTQFNTWVQSSDEIMASVKARANNPKNIWIREVHNSRGFDIPGIKKGRDPATGEVAPFPKGYQFVAINRFGRSFGGILGDGVGLGKTYQALWTAKHVHNIGAKKKTAIVVPNSVLPNWRKEASKTYESLDRCLFVGLEFGKDDDGNPTVVRQSGDLVKRHLNQIIENRHDTIFMTVDDFISIPLKDETIESYKQYLIQQDAALAGMTSTRADAKEKADAFLAALTATMEKRQKDAVPFFEVMGIDSIVFDEAHVAKNSKEVIEFKGAKMLATPEASARGLDMQCKSWLVRGANPHGDGVLCLTATPITNSPLEIFSMLTLAVGEERVKRMMMDCEGADSFMNLFSIVEDQEGVTISGDLSVARTFEGLQNLQVLREAMRSVALIRTSDEVGEETKVPEAVEKAVGVELPAETLSRLQLYKLAYAGARKGDKAEAHEVAALMQVHRETGDPILLIGHPFNLIKKMQSLIMDPDMDQGVTRYSVSDKALAAQVIKRFNDAKVREERERTIGQLATNDEIIKVVYKDEEGKVVASPKPDEKVVAFYTVHVKAFYDDAKSQVVVDTAQYKSQAAFVQLAEKQKLDLDVSVPPKLSSLIENFQIEQAHPRHGSHAKQLIFVDMLAMHQKIRIALSKHCGVPRSAIAIINAQAVDDASEVQDISDGFNADGAENRFSSIIANKKAEVGLNLQKGTQAIHHMTLGWTPDSVTQRNGRGVRQGNPLDYVNVYYYEADGTFDRYKRTLVSKKGDWISEVMKADGAETVQAAGQISEKDADEMIRGMGDEKAMSEFERQRAEQDRLERARAARESQAIIARTVEKQTRVTKTTFEGFVKKEVGLLSSYADAIKAARKRMEKAKSDSASAKAKALLDEASANYNATLSRIGDTTKDGVQAANYESVGKAKLRDAVADWVDGNQRRDLYIGSFFKPERIDETSELYQQWSSGRARAEKIIEQSIKDFETYANMGTGGYSKEAMQKLVADDAVMVGDKIVWPGCLIDAGKEGMAFVTDGNKVIRPGQSTYNAPSVADVLGKGAKAFEPGTQGFVDVATRMAAADDALIAKGTYAFVEEYEKNQLYSHYVPAVSQYMTQKIERKFYARDLELPPPFLPKLLIPSAGYEAAPIAKAFMEQQRDAGIVVTGSGYSALVKLPDGVEPGEGRAQDGPLIAGLMVSMAKAKGIKATQYDAAECDTQFGACIEVADEQNSVIAGINAMTAETAPNLGVANDTAWGLVEALAYVDVKRADLGNQDFGGNYTLPKTFRSAFVAKVMELRQKWNAAPAPTGGTPPNPTPAPDGSAGIPANLVGVISAPLDPKFMGVKGKGKVYLAPNGNPVMALYNEGIAAGLKLGNAWEAASWQVTKNNLPASWTGKKIAYVYE